MKVKTILKSSNITLLTLTAFLSSCASYDAAPLNGITINSSEPSDQEIMVTAKAFDRNDCITYLDRDVIRKGYQPVQLYIENNSDKNYIFSLNRISLPCARPEEVADRVHTSTVGRIVGYGAGAFFFSWLFFPAFLVIPAIVDGIKSSEANTALDMDFIAKTAKDQVVFAHSHVNTLIFVPVRAFQQTFDITLIEKETNQTKDFNISAL